MFFIIFEPIPFQGEQLCQVLNRYVVDLVEALSHHVDSIVTIVERLAESLT